MSGLPDNIDAMRTNAREKIKKRAKTLVSKSTHESVTLMLTSIAEEGDPQIICGGDEATECKFSTVGLSLHGFPELFIMWPCPSMADAANRVLNDLILDCMNGNFKEKLRVGRRVWAVAFGIAYRVEVSPDFGESSLLYKFFKENRTSKIKKSNAPFALKLNIIADVRDDVDLLNGVQNGLAMWRNKDGVSTFTGLVRCPIPSPNWMEAGFDYCMVRMLDPNTEDIESPCRVATPDEVLEIFSKFDNFGD